MRLLVTFPLSLGTRGGGTVGCLNILKQLRAAGAEVTVLPLLTHIGLTTPRPPLPPELRGEERTAELQQLGIEVVPVRPARHYGLDARAMRRAVSKQLAGGAFDAVLGWHQEFAGLPKWLRSRGVGSGVIAAGLYEHLIAPRRRGLPRRSDLRDALQRSLIRGGLRHADAVFAISAYLGRNLAEVFGLDERRIHTAPWGVDPAFGQARRAPAGAVERLLFYGSAAPRKGIPDALAALGRMAERGNRSWTFKVVAWDRAAVERLAQEHGIADRVVLLDPMDHAALIGELEWAQLALLPSAYESFGLACAECQASGLPVIAYDVGGVGEVIEDGVSGWLAPLGEVDALVAALEAAVADPAETYRRGLAGRDRVTELYTWPRTAQLILDGVRASRQRPR